jgi:hypothetical protein
VIDHQIENEIVSLRQVLDVRPTAEPWIDFGIRQRREPTIT